MRTSGLTGSRVQEQKLEVRLVSDTSKPTTLLNHWRSDSTRDTMAMGTLKMLLTCEEMWGRGERNQEDCFKTNKDEGTAQNPQHWGLCAVPRDRVA